LGISSKKKREQGGSKKKIKVKEWAAELNQELNLTPTRKKKVSGFGKDMKVYEAL